MKNILYVIAILLLLIWINVFKLSSSAHLWPAAGGIVVLIRIVFDKKLSIK